MGKWIHRLLAAVVIAFYVWGCMAAIGDVPAPPVLGAMHVLWYMIVPPLVGALLVCFGESFYDFLRPLAVHGSTGTGFGPHAPGCMVRFVGWVLLLWPAAVNLMLRHV